MADKEKDTDPMTPEQDLLDQPLTEEMPDLNGDDLPSDADPISQSNTGKGSPTQEPDTITHNPAPLSNKKPRLKKKGGRPKKGDEINWEEVETLYITSNMRIKDIATQIGCSLPWCLEQSRTRNWVSKRKKYQAELQTQARDKAITLQAKTLAEEVDDISGLAHAILSRLRTNITQRPIKVVSCTCGKVHTVALPWSVTVDDLVKLMRIRSHLKGDPDFIVKTDSTVTVRKLREMPEEELKARMEEVIKEADGYVLE